MPDADDIPAPTVEAMEKALARKRMDTDAWVAWAEDEAQAADYISELFTRDTLAVRAYAALNLMVTKILAGNLEIKGTSVAPVLNALSTIARLESNEPTQINADLTPAERKELAAKLREKVQARVQDDPLPIIEAETLDD